MNVDEFDKPIILIGAARSGTKFLRDCLAASPNCSAVPYDINYIWRYKQEKLRHDVLDPNLASPKIRSFIHKSIIKLSKAEKGDRIIEKTVSNTLRIPFIDKIYPNAIYVHLIRDGRDVVESSMRQWAAPPKAGALLTKLKSIPLQNVGYVFWYAGNLVSGFVKGGRKGGNIWGPRYPGITENARQVSLADVCARQWKNCVEKSVKDLGDIDPRRVHTIRYEDFVSNKKSLIDLADKLGLKNPYDCAEAMQKNVRIMGGVPAWTTLPAKDIEMIESVISDTLSNLGYK